MIHGCPDCAPGLPCQRCEEPQVHPARVQSVEPAQAIGSALPLSSSSSVLDLTPIRARLEREGILVREDADVVFAEVDRLRAEHAVKDADITCLREDTDELVETIQALDVKVESAESRLRALRTAGESQQQLTTLERERAEIAESRLRALEAALTALSAKWRAERSATGTFYANALAACAADLDACLAGQGREL